MNQEITSLRIGMLYQGVPRRHTEFRAHHEIVSSGKTYLSEEIGLRIESDHRPEFAKAADDPNRSPIAAKQAIEDLWNEIGEKELRPLWQVGTIYLYGRAPLSEAYERIPISVSRDSKCVINYYGNTVDTGLECWEGVHVLQTKGDISPQSLLELFEKNKDNLLEPVSDLKRPARNVTRAKKASPAENAVIAACEAWWPRHNIPSDLGASERNKIIKEWVAEFKGRRNVSDSTILRGLKRFQKNGMN